MSSLKYKVIVFEVFKNRMHVRFSFLVLLFLFAIVDINAQSPWTESSGNVFRTSGNVGIGLSTPTEKLEVDGGVKISSNLILNDLKLARFNSGTLRFQSNSSIVARIQLDDKEGSRYGSLFGVGNESGTMIGLLDGDNHWSYHAVKDSYTRFLINNSEKMRIESSGEIGIGTTAPAFPLHIRVNRHHEQLFIEPATPSGQDAGIVIQGARNGTTSSNQATLSFKNNDSHLATPNFLGRIAGRVTNATTNVGDLVIYNYADGNTLSETMRFTKDSNVGIGVGNPTEKLEVNGKIRTQEVIVTQENWPDYVFEKDYDLSPLSKVEEYIQAHKHLPNIPKGKTIEEEGLELGEMNKLLLEKIEELTLHLIDQDKRLKILEEENSKLRNNKK